jgi:hypothetical protein
MKPQKLLLTFFLFTTFISGAQIIHVPADQPTIQEGINAASDGDTVLVAENTYYENIKFMGKAITVASEFILDGNTSHIDNTIIDGSQAVDPDSAATVMFINGEDTASIINGFTIRGGAGVFNMTYQARMGGGIYSYNSGNKILNNIITENHVEDDDKAGGAGIACAMDDGNHWTIIENNTINYNTSNAQGYSAFGGGIYVIIHSILKNNVIEYNTCTNSSAMADGGGIELESLPGWGLTALIQGNIIRNNELIGNSDAFGGGIVSNGVSSNIINNTISDNSISAPSNAFGGGIYMYGPPDKIEISDNNIESNDAFADFRVRGGGIWFRSSDSCKIENNVFQNNSLNGNKAIGGGIYSWQNNYLQVNDNLFNQNVCNADSSWGGAMCSINSGKLIFQNNTVCNNEMNSTVYWFGSGMWVENTSDEVHISNNNFVNNSGTEEVSKWSLGGAIGLFSGLDSLVVIDANIIKQHKAERGGGIWTFNTYNLQLTNNIFISNEAILYGGGICFEQNETKTANALLIENKRNGMPFNPSRESYFHPLIANNTFLFNRAEWGGAIDCNHGFETPVIFNSIFWGNEADTIPDISNYTSQEMLVSYCNIDTSQIFDAWFGENNILCNPSFMSDSLHLDWPSLCVNAGIDAFEFDGASYYCPETDIDGEDRPFEWTMPDIGADEAQWYYVSVDEASKTNNLNLRAYPNPFSSSISIEYELERPANIQLEIYNQLGEQVEQITDYRSLGNHQFIWQAERLPAGIYFCVIKTKQGTQTTKLIKL